MHVGCHRTNASMIEIKSEIDDICVKIVVAVLAREILKVPMAPMTTVGCVAKTQNRPSASSPTPLALEGRWCTRVFPIAGSGEFCPKS